MGIIDSLFSSPNPEKSLAPLPLALEVRSEVCSDGSRCDVRLLDHDGRRRCPGRWRLVRVVRRAFRSDAVIAALSPVSQKRLPVSASRRVVLVHLRHGDQHVRAPPAQRASHAFPRHDLTIRDGSAADVAIAARQGVVVGRAACPAELARHGALDHVSVELRVPLVVVLRGRALQGLRLGLGWLLGLLAVGGGAAALYGGCGDTAEGAVAEGESADGEAAVVCRILLDVVEAIGFMVDGVVVVVVLREAAVCLDRVEARDGDE